MATLTTRSTVLAGAIAAGLLFEAAISELAHATDALAFGNTLNLDPSLELFDSTGKLIATVTTSSALGIFQGFISNTDGSVVPSVGGPNGKNTSYAAGSYGGMVLIDYFGFNLASLPSTVTTIASATLVVESGKVTDDVTYSLFGATQWVTQLETPGAQNAALYANMVNGAGANSYGSFQVAQNLTNSMTELMFVLNGAAVSDINAAIQTKTVFALAGQVSAASVPEPSTWVMLLAGFAGLGVVARRRAVKRRAAAG